MRRLRFLVGLWAALWGCNEDTLRGVRPQLVSPPAVLDFGAVPVLNEKNVDLEMANVGRGDLNVLGVSLREEGTPFSLRSVPGKVQAGETARLTVAFVPPGENDFRVMLDVLTDDPDLPRFEVELLGKGSTRAKIEVEPALIDFGRVGECGTALQTLSLKSVGTADLIIEELAWAEGSSPDFSIIGSTKTPVVVKTVGPNGLPGQLLLTLRYSVPEGAALASSATLRIRTTDPEAREITVAMTGTPNRAPVAVIAPLGNGALGQEVFLDGSASSDADGDAPLSYKWSLRQKPLGATTTLSSTQQATSSMRLDNTLIGAYEVELSVTDSTGVKSCRPARATLVASPAEKLLVEMFWNNLRTDMDLHFLRDSTSMVGVAPDDCFYGNPRPDWGVLGDASDDPAFLRDALTGYGPESVGYINPVAGTYRLVVEHARANLAPDPTTEITVRIYFFGVLKAEYKKTLLQQGEIWPVADVRWPTGDVTAVE